MKYKRIAGLAFVAMFATLAITLPMGVWAEGDASDASESETVAEENVTEVSTYAELHNASLKGGHIKLMADIEATNYVQTRSNTTFDLNGHTVSFADKFFWYVYAYGSTDAVVTFVGDGTIRHTNPEDKSTLIRAHGGYATDGAKSVAVLNDVTVIAPTYAVTATSGGQVVVNDGAKILSDGYGIAAYKDAVIEVNGGEIESKLFAIAGNGTEDMANAKFYIKGGKITSTDDYAIYVPQIGGVLEISGGEITGARGAVAANRGKIAVSGDAKLVSEGTFEASGDVAKDGTRGYTNAVIGMAHEYDDVTLNVSGGTFVAKGDAIMFGDPANGYNTTHTYSVEVSGGRFESASSKVAEGYGDELVEVVTDGKDVYDLGSDGPWIVDDVTTVSLPEETVYVKLGDTMDLGGHITDIAKKYGTFGVADDAAMTIDKETLVATATKTGTAIINFQLHNHKNEVDKSFSVVVYGIDSEDDANEKGSDEETHNEDLMASATNGVTRALLDFLNSYANASIENPGSVTLADGTKAEITANASEISRALANGGKVVAKLVEADVALNDTDSAKVKAKMAEGAKVAKTLDYAILLSIDSSNDSTMLGKITETATDLGITVDVSGVEAEEDGYRRAYQVIRLHDGEEEAAVLGGTYSTTDKTVSFASNKFSTFTLAYVDTQVVVDNGDDNTEDTESTETPDTGTFTGSETSVSAGNVVAIVAALAVITAVVVGAVKFAKR